MAPSKTDPPYRVPLDKEQRDTLGNWLGLELRNADASRQSNLTDVDRWWALYEQARMRSDNDLPWPDAADLTSYIPCEKVDAVHARIMRTVWTSPVWTVEGWGQAANRAPFVEEFHQWKAEEERLQNVLDKVALTAVVEPRCLVEVYESSQRRTSRRELTVRPVRTGDGGVVFDAKGQPQLQRNEQTGAYVEANPDELGISTVVDSSEVIRTGPQYRVLPYEDSLILPGHARDKEEIWGYAKRIWKRYVDLKADAANGLYEQEPVDRMTQVGDRQPTPSLIRNKETIAPQQDPQTAEKELWEVLILLNLNELLERHGRTALSADYSQQRWYVITIHQIDNTILRVDHDNFERSRFINFVLFPRPNRATEGYSLVGHKLLSLTEEHMAYRNMAADKSSMKVNAPIKKVAGALWDEDEQPWGPKAVITVRDHREIEQQVVEDVPQSIFAHIQYCDRSAERVAGVNDIASGQVASESRTLGEVQMATEQSFVRMDLIVRRFQESLEDLGQIRHAIWKRCLSEYPTGIDAPESVIVGLEGRGVPIERYMPNNKITAALLDGSFRFRPYGSVETADPGKRRADLLGLLALIPRLMQTFPALAQQFQSIAAGRAFTREALRAFRFPNVQAILGSPAADLSQQMAIESMPMPSLAPPNGMGPEMQRSSGLPPQMMGAPPTGAPVPPPPMPPAPGPIGPQ